MDRNTLIGLLLIGVIIIGYSFYTQPSKEELSAQKRQQDSIAVIQKQQAQKQLQNSITGTVKSAVNIVVADTNIISDSARKESDKQRLGIFADATQGEKKFITLENELIKVTLSSKGGKVHAVELKKYKTFDKKPLNLLDADSSTFRLQFFTKDNIPVFSDSLYFKPLGSSLVVNKDETKTVSLRMDAGNNKYIEYQYSLTGNSYVLGFKINIVGLNDVIAPNSSSINLVWNSNIPKQEHSIDAERKATTVYFEYLDNEVDYITETSDEKKSLATKVKWIAFKQQYFTSVLIADNGFEKPTTVETITDKESHKYVKKLSADITLAYNHKEQESFPMRFYFGPNHYQLLKKLDLNLEKQIPLGWGIFRWVNRFLVIPTFNFLSQFNMNYGIIILLLTILIKIVLLPLTYKSYLSTAKMKILKPEIDEITAKNKKGDAMKIQQETMALYRKAGVNPLGGCLPMLLQMPILIAMFNFFPASIELRQQGFLWATDLSTYDSIWTFGYVPLINDIYGDHVSLFTLLMTISTLLYTMQNNKMMMGGSNSAMNTQMKWMGYLMPIVFLGVFNNYSAGLSYYYFLANMLTFGQQYLIRLFVDEQAIHLKMQEYRKRPQAQKKSKFQQKLEEMAKARGYKMPK